MCQKKIALNIIDIESFIYSSNNIVNNFDKIKLCSVIYYICEK